MKKKMLLPIFIIVILSAVLFFVLSSSKKLVVRSHTDQSPYSIHLSGWVAHVTAEVETEVYEHATYTHYHFKDEDQSFRLSLIDMEHGDTLYFANNYSNTSDKTVYLNILVNDRSEKLVHMRNIEDKEESWDTFPHDFNSFQQSIYVDGEHASYKIGMVNETRSLGYTVFQVNQSASISTEKTYKGLSYTIPLNAEADTWGILASQPIIHWDEPSQLYLLSQIEFDLGKKLTLNGAFYETPSSYQPYGENSYYYNPANLDGLRSIPYLSVDTFGSFFTNIATHLAYASSKLQNDQGYWPTYPRSNWLYEEYGIEYLYMDNRRNVDNVMFLLEFNKEKYDPVIEASLKKWDHYHLKYIREHGIKLEKGGLLIPDYVGHSPHKLAHVSLNHLAANINYLLMAYKETNNEEQLKAAEDLIEGIGQTRDLWLADDHNLHYALTSDLKVYPADDYHTLTRDDLVQTQLLLVEIKGEINEDIQYLIKEKNIWIKENHPDKL